MAFFLLLFAPVIYFVLGVTNTFWFYSVFVAVGLFLNHFQQPTKKEA